MLGTILQSSWAQGDTQEDFRIYYGDENTFSAGLLTNGYCIGYRYAKRKTARLKSLYEIQFSSIHHQKEIKVSADLGGKFIYGKLNSTYALLFSTGFQNEKFSKLDKRSVAIRYIHRGGLSLGFEKPYYYIIVDNNERKFEKFDASNTSKNGKAPFFIGLNETTILPGLFWSSSVNFEFSIQDDIIRALEFGFSLQAFPRKIEIMYTQDNNQFFTNLFIIYRFGKPVK